MGEVSKVGNWSERRVLVTGASGMVGSWLCQELSQRGAFVVALTRDTDPQSRFFSDAVYQNCTIVNGDLSEIGPCMRAINDHEIEVVFHLGAQTIVGAALRDPLECFESNIRGTYNLLEAARRLRPLAGTVIVASSDKAYGESEVLPYVEAMPLRGRHPYDVSKSCTDLITHTYGHTYQMNVMIARCGNIYGGGDLNWSRIVPGTIRSLLAGQSPVLRSDGNMLRDYIFVDDVVSAYITLAEHGSNGEYAGDAFNFSPEKNYNVLQMVKMIGDVMKISMEPVIQNSATMEIRNQTLDSSKAKRLLSWSCRWNLEDGLRETVNWYITHLSLPKTARA